MRRRSASRADADAAAAEQAEDEEKTERDESSEDEDEDEEQLPETAIIKCQGCKATEDTGGPETLPWLMCDCCSVWMHGKCVGRWTIEKCEDLPFVCFECQRANIQTTSPTKKSLRRPCTAWCKPPGCAGGKGCDAGMGKWLTAAQRQLIEDLVIRDVQMQRRFHNGEISPLPMERGVYDDERRGLVPCTIISWQLNVGTATVAFYIDNTPLGLRKKDNVPLRRIARFAPRWTAAELDIEAVRCGCTQFSPPSKQLRYEMRMVRKRYGYKLPMTPAGYLRKMKASSVENGGTEQQPPTQVDAAAGSEATNSCPAMSELNGPMNCAPQMGHELPGTYKCKFCKVEFVGILKADMTRPNSKHEES